MNGPVVVGLVFMCAAAVVTAALIGSDLIREALDELEARREWAEIQRRSDARRYLSNTSPRSVK